MLLNTITKTLNIVGKKKCFNILILSLILTIFEIFGVALILPLIDILLTDNDDFIYKYSFLNLDKISKTNLIKYSLIFFIMFFLLKTFLSIFVNRIFVNLVYNLRTLIQKTLLTNFVYQEYNFHLKKNSSELINIISNEVNNFCGSNLLPLMSLVSEGLIVVGLLTLMLWYEPIGFMYAIVTLLIPAMIFYRISKKKQKALGIFRNFYDVLSLKHLQQVIFGIREVKISTTEDIFIREYSDNINNSANSLFSILWKR
jgi:ABC-type bacteriocin/lantibiotic exporter with double-glycine peptidase domain